jgi:hypothetical protein
MRSERAASDHEQTLGRTSLLILAALSLAAVFSRHMVVGVTVFSNQ